METGRGGGSALRVRRYQSRCKVFISCTVSAERRFRHHNYPQNAQIHTVWCLWLWRVFQVFFFTFPFFSHDSQWLTRKNLAATTGDGKCMSVFQSQMKKKKKKAREGESKRHLNRDLKCKAQKDSVWVCGVPCKSIIICRLMFTGQIKNEDGASSYLGNTATVLYYNGSRCCCVKAVEDALSSPGHLRLEPGWCWTLLFPGTQSLLITLHQCRGRVCVLRPPHSPPPPSQRLIWLKCQSVVSCSLSNSHSQRSALSGDCMSYKKKNTKIKICGVGSCNVANKLHQFVFPPLWFV